MGLFDFIFAPFQQAGQQTIQNITGQVTASPAPAPVQASQPAPQQQVPQSPFSDPVGWLGGAVNYVGSGVTNISSGIQTFIQPVAQPVSQAIQAIPAFISAPVTAPVIIGSAFIGGVQPILNPPVQQIAPTGLGGGAVYTPAIIPTQQLPAQQVPSGGFTIYTAYGSQAQQQIKNINALLIAPTAGSFEATQIPYGHYISNIAASGGPGSLQSGMFTLNPATPIVYTQGGATQGILAAAAVPAAAALVLASPQSYSRLGAEVYGGYVMPLDNRVLTPGTQMGVYPASTGNLANLVNPYGVNQPKQNWEVLPWNVPVQTTPGIYSYSKTGIVTPISAAGLESIGMAAPVSIPTTQMSSMGKTMFMTTQVAGTEQKRDWLGQLNYDLLGLTGMGAQGLEQTPSGLPAPFRSTYGGETTIVPPTGNVFGYNLWGVSPILAFFQPGKQVTTQLNTAALPEVTTLKGTTIENIPGGTLTTQFFEATGGKKTTTTITETPTKSGFDLFEQSIRNMIPTPEVGEQGMRYAALANPFTAPTVVASLLTETFNPEQASGARAIESVAGLRGQYTQFYEHPTMMATSYGIGALFGTATKGISGAYELSRASAAEQIISRGQTYRAAEMYSGFVMENAPKILGALYVGSIAQRSTEGFTNFAPETVAMKSKGLVMQEAVPMGMGFMLPSQIVTAAKVSDIGYQEALLKGKGDTLARIGEGTVGEAGKGVVEGSTTGRIDYYIRQPAAAAYETAISPLAKARLEFPQFVEEAGGSNIKGALSYAGYKIGTEQPVAIEIIRPTIAPEMEFATGNVYQGKAGAMDYIAAKINQPITPEVSRNYYPYEGIEQTAYPKAEVKIQPEINRNYYDYLGIEREAYPTNSFIISAKSAWQEWRTPERLLYFSSYGGYNFISQGLPPQGWAGIDTIGTRGIPTGGLGGTGSRMETKIVGGREVTGLAREPSLKSQGIIETSGRAGETGISDFVSKRSIDYSGSQSQTMKPMRPESYGYQETKQATGIQIFSEQLPMVEGMTEGKVMPQQQAQRSFMVSPFAVPAAATETISVIEPELMFSQASELRQQQVQQQEPVLGRISFAAQVPASIGVASVQEVLTGQRQEQILAQFNVVSQRSASQTQQAVRETVSSRDVLYGLDIARVSDIVPVSRQRTDQFVTPFSDVRLASDITPRFDQRITQRVDQRITTDIRPYTWQIPTPTTTPFGLPGFSLPGSGPGSFGRKRRAAFTETFNMGLDFSLRKPSKKKGKSWTSPKYPRRIKQGGKKK